MFRCEVCDKVAFFKALPGGLVDLEEARAAGWLRFQSDDNRCHDRCPDCRDVNVGANLVCGNHPACAASGLFGCKPSRMQSRIDSRDIPSGCPLRKDA